MNTENSTASYKKMDNGKTFADSDRVEPRKKSFRNATRIQESVTSGPERKALLWLAARIPASVIPIT